MTFESFSREPGSEAAFTAARRFARSPHGEWLVIASKETGNGKTHLLCAVANTLMAEGIPVLYSFVPHLLDHLRAGYSRSGRRYGPGDELDQDEAHHQFEQRWNQVLNIEALLLDDLGVEQHKPWVMERLESLVNWRYDHRLATAITTNLTLAQIGEWSPRIRSRIERYPATVTHNAAGEFHKRGRG